MVFTKRSGLISLIIIFILLLLNFFVVSINFNFYQSKIQTLAKDKISADADSYLAHLFLTGNAPLLKKSIDQYKNYGITCFKLIDNELGFKYGFGENCSESHTAYNYLDQSIYQYQYTLPEISLFRFIELNIVSMSLYLILELVLIALFIVFYRKYLIAMEKNKANEKISSIIRRVKHDMQSPLIALDMAVENSQNTDYENKKLMLTSLNRLKSIVNDLYRTQASLSFNEKLNLPIYYIINEVINEKELEYFSKSVKFTHHQDNLYLYAKISHQVLMRIFSNLINNAIDAIEVNPQIEIFVKEDHDFIKIQIKDNGSGISEQKRKYIFQKGYSTKQTGLGEGLSSARDFLNSFGGKITLLDTGVNGSTFEIVLNKSDDQKLIPRDITLSDKDIFILDDESVIFEKWKEVLSKSNINYKSLNYSEVLNEEILLEKNVKSIYLVDYDFAQKYEDGLNFIIKNKLEKQAYLVTGRFIDQNIFQDLVNYNIQVIPKLYIDYLKII